jgi:REP element-mobilizing transposase RayT
MHDRILLHIAWTTRHRQPLINLERAMWLSAFLPVIARQERGRILRIGMVTTHLHIVTRVHPTTQIPRLLQRMKGGATFHLNRVPTNPGPPIRWANGYSVTSISPRDLHRVVRYVADQATRHPQEAIAGFDPAEVNSGGTDDRNAARSAIAGPTTVQVVPSGTSAEPPL